MVQAFSISLKGLIVSEQNYLDLEIIKIIVKASTPVIVACIGYFIHHTLKRLEHSQWRSQKLIERKLQVYDEIAPHLNDLLCYFTRVGNWKEQTPDYMVAMKRDLDRKIYLAAPLFSADFLTSPQTFIDSCYKTFSGAGQDAKLKTGFADRKAAFGASWQVQWDARFSNVDIQTQENIKKRYWTVMYIFSRDIGVLDANQ